MSLIDSTYFKIEINAPDDIYSNIQDYIDRYEPEILRSLLGYELYELVIAENPTEQRILDLRDGVEYSVNGIQYKWNGFKNEEKISLIAYYVAYWYMRLNISETSTVSELQVNPENANIANPSLKVQMIWMLLSELYGSNIHPEKYESAYGFLNYHSEDYPEWNFSELGSVNAFDL